MNQKLQSNIEYTQAVQELKKILEPITEEMCHINNVDMARLTFPHNVIPYDVEPELWKPLTYPSWQQNRYIVSSWGRVYNIVDNYFLTSDINDKGYVKVCLMRNKETKANLSPSSSTPIHRLVALTFLPEHERHETVNHKNLDKLNNCLYNLEFISNEDNVKHAHINKARPKKEYSYFTKEEIQEIRRKFEKENCTIIGLAKEYDKNIATIRKIVRYKSYPDDYWDKLGFTSERVKYYINQRKKPNPKLFIYKIGYYDNNNIFCEVTTPCATKELAEKTIQQLNIDNLVILPYEIKTN
jgi:hypothetical protein